jgi:hypothetical protein
MARARRGRVVEVPEVRTGDPVVDRALDAIRTIVAQLAQRPAPRAILQVALVSGLNKLDHGLDSPPITFGWVTDTDGALISSAQAENPLPSRQLWVRLSGAPTAAAELMVY